MIWPLAVVLADKDGNDKVGDEHAYTTAEQELASSESVHAPERPETGNDLADVEDAGHGQLHFVVETHGGEKSWGVVLIGHVSLVMCSSRLGHLR